MVGLPYPPTPHERHAYFPTPTYTTPSVVDASGSKQLDEILALLKKQQDEISDLKTQVAKPVASYNIIYLTC